MYLQVQYPRVKLKIKKMQMEWEIVMMWMILFYPEPGKF